jgi:hypothetical protein
MLECFQFCGPECIDLHTADRIRACLGLMIPGQKGSCRIRVGDERSKAGRRKFETRPISIERRSSLTSCAILSFLFSAVSHAIIWVSGRYLLLGTKIRSWAFSLLAMSRLDPLRPLLIGRIRIWRRGCSIAAEYAQSEFPKHVA